MRICTAGTDLQEALPKIYKGKQYRDEKTNDVYEFISFIDYCSGQVRARNVTKDITELLTSKEWFSLHSIPKERRKKQKQ